MQGITKKRTEVLKRSSKYKDATTKFSTVLCRDLHISFPGEYPNLRKYVLCLRDIASVRKGAISYLLNGVWPDTEAKWSSKFYCLTSYLRATLFIQVITKWYFILLKAKMRDSSDLFSFWLSLRFDTICETTI